MRRHPPLFPVAVTASRTLAPGRDAALLRLTAAGALLAGAALVLAGPARAASHEEIIVSHGVTNFGDLKHPADMAHLPYVNPDAPKGGEIAIWSQGTFDSFNAYSRKGVSAALSTLPYESVMVSAADDPYGSYCYLCETLEYPESRDWVIFNLRQDVTFSDGTPMTAEDVEFSFDLFMEQGITEYRNVVGGFISDVEVLDPHRIRFTFAEDAPRRDVLGIAGGQVVFSKAWFEQTGTRLDDSSDAPFLGTGAYLLQSQDPNRQLVYARDPDHWGADHPWNIGQNNFDTIRVEYFGDSQAAFEGFKAGAYTFRNENSSKEWGTSYDFPAVQNGTVIKAELPDGNIGSAQAFVFNLDKPRWQDPRVREAVRMMFNFEWSNEALFYGLYERVNSFWENSNLEATGVPTEAEIALLKPLVDEGLLDASILTDEAVMAPTNRAEDNTPARAELRRAAGLLEEAGWIPGDDGIRTRDGQRLTLEFLSFSPAFDRIINPYIENLQRIGIDATLNRVDNSTYVDLRRTGDFDITTHTFSMDFEPGVGLRQWYDSSTADDSSRNLMRLRNPAIDRLVTHVVDATTLEDLTTATHALDRALRIEGFWVPQWFKDVHTVAYYDIFGYPDPLPPYARGELSFWWYDAERAAELEAAGAFQ